MVGLMVGQVQHVIIALRIIPEKIVIAVLVNGAVPPVMNAHRTIRAPLAIPVPMDGQALRVMCAQ